MIIDIQFDVPSDDGIVFDLRMVAHKCPGLFWVGMGKSKAVPQPLFDLVDQRGRQGMTSHQGGQGHRQVGFLLPQRAEVGNKGKPFLFVREAAFVNKNSKVYSAAGYCFFNLPIGHRYPLIALGKISAQQQGSGRHRPGNGYACSMRKSVLPIAGN